MYYHYYTVYSDTRTAVDCPPAVLSDDQAICPPTALPLAWPSQWTHDMESQNMCSTTFRSTAEQEI